MKQLFKQVIIWLVLVDKISPSHHKSGYSDFKLAKGFRELKIIMGRIWRDVLIDHFVWNPVGCIHSGLKIFYCPINLLKVEQPEFHYWQPDQHLFLYLSFW
jgi:hypothetical protein